MPHNRYYLPLQLDTRQAVDIEEQEFHHLTRVMRQSVGDEIELINGTGTLANAVIDSISKSKARCTITSTYFEKPRSKCFTLALAIQRQNHIEIAIEKATEIGASNIILFPAKKSEKKDISPNNLTRLEHIIISATKQCGRLYVPELKINKSQNECLIDTAFTLHGTFENAVSFCNVREKIAKENHVVLFIGPEAGFTDEEITNFQAKGSCGISLCPHILRAETAAIVGCALITEAMQKYT